MLQSNLELSILAINNTIKNLAPNAVALKRADSELQAVALVFFFVVFVLSNAREY